MRADAPERHSDTNLPGIRRATASRGRDPLFGCLSEEAQPHAFAAGWQLGVERLIASSSSVISTGTSANSGVLR